MMSYQINLDGHKFSCPGDLTILLAMRKLGLAHLPVGCCAGGCGICKVKVIAGSYETKVMSRAKVTVEEESQGYALACRIVPRSDLTIKQLNKNELD